MAMLALRVSDERDVSGDKLALLWADGRIGRVSAGFKHQTRALKPQKAHSDLPLDMLVDNTICLFKQSN